MKLERVLIGIAVTLIASQLVEAQATDPVSEHVDLVFAEIDGDELKLDLFVPKSESRPPLVVWIHGGGWRGGSRKNLPLKKLTEDGYALASISYRFTDKAQFPAQIHDCKAAVRWLRANANQYGYNADWIAVGGSSAGGHLALLMGVSANVADLEGTIGSNRDESSAVQAVIDYFGPSDFALRGKTQPEQAYSTKAGSFALLGGVRVGMITPEAERFASPSTYVTKDDPPLLIFHGEKDSKVLIDQSERMASLYKQIGLKVQLVVVEEAGHGGDQFFNPKNFAIAKEFLEGQRRIQQEAP